METKTASSPYQTIADLALRAIPEYNKPDCMIAKRDGVYQNLAANEIFRTIEAVAARLLELGVKKGDRIGILSENRPEWAQADLAIICCGAISVPIYGTLPGKQIEYITRDSGMEIIFVSTETQLNKLLDVQRHNQAIRRMVVFDPPALMPEGAVSWNSMISEGKSYLERDKTAVKSRANEIRPEDVFTIVYTSGTTGEPKGVMLTHLNILSNIEATIERIPFDKTQTSLSFLPLSHILERMAGYYSMLYCGASIAYSESIEAMPKNLLEVRPTVLMSVPRVYEKFYARIMESIASGRGIKKKLAVWALRIAAEYTDAKLGSGPVPYLLQCKYAMADKLVLSKIRERLGGRLRWVISGGAALPKQLAHFFYGMGIVINEGYGLTETSPVISVNAPDQLKFGTVGRPIDGVEVKIAPDGEILTRGPHVMKGYYNKPRETAEVIDPEGWLHTGDIGELDADGFLKITDRKKDLIVTSAGKNIAPQFVENILKTCSYITQIVVVGDRRNFPSALIVPNMEQLKQLGASKQVPESELLTHPVIHNQIQQEIDRLSTDLAPFERVKKFVLLTEEFTVESGELTPSMKVKRKVVEQRYKSLIDRLYSEAALT